MQISTPITLVQKTGALQDCIVSSVRGAMLNASVDEAAALQALEISESTYESWRKQAAAVRG